jgi:2-polyprenyl-3-methyl-5-hydroxy-6-metoxy-1,4-benzoquinol methylase
MSNPTKIQSWSEISPNPNSPEALEFRVKSLESARDCQLIENRVSYISWRAKNRSVLDIGVVEHFSESASIETWLHQHVSQSASTCLGIDILEGEVNQLRERGYKVKVHDITKSPLAQKFELIIVGDVVEHLNNPGALFKNAAVMLEENGRLLITTPNPWYANAMLKNTFEGRPFTDSVDHIAWFCAATLCELASRNGLQLVHYCGVKADKSASLKSIIFFKLASLFIKIGIRPEVFAKTMIYEFALVPICRD